MYRDSKHLFVHMCHHCARTSDASI